MARPIAHKAPLCNSAASILLVTLTQCPFLPRSSFRRCNSFSPYQGQMGGYSDSPAGFFIWLLAGVIHYFGRPVTPIPFKIPLPAPSTSARNPIRHATFPFSLAVWDWRYTASFSRFRTLKPQLRGWPRHFAATFFQMLKKFSAAEQGSLFERPQLD